MASGTLQLRTFRDLAPDSDDELADFLVARVRQAVPTRQAGPSMVVVRGSRIDLIAVSSVPQMSVSTPAQALALLSRAHFSDGTQSRAIGLIGVFGYRKTPDAVAVPTALVFIEWPDGRWWQWRALIEPSTHHLIEQTQTISRAVDGIARPRGLGGWWTRGRHLRADVRFAPIMPLAGGDVVH